MKNLIKITLLITIVLVSCTKAGTGGANKINVFIFRDSLENLCTNCKVYIRYGTIEFPGEDSLAYDDSGVTDLHGKYTFLGLKKGNYAFYGWGKDPLYGDTIHGFVSHEIENYKNERDVTLYADTTLVIN